MTYDDPSNLKSVTDSVLNVTNYDYSQRDELISETNTLGKSRTFTYDQVGNLASKTDRNNRTTKFEYDRLDRLKNEQWKDATNSTVRTLTYDYDAASRLTAAIDPDSRYTYSYDQADRLTQSSNAGTAGVPTVSFTYGYDAANHLVSTQDTIAGQLRGTTNLTRDRLNRVTQMQQSGVGVTNKRVDLNYDTASQLKGIKRYTDLGGTQLVAATEYNYDLAGRLQDLTHRKANNATIAPYTLAYDAADRLTQVNSIDGPNTFNYDATDQLTSATQANENYTYDLNGNRTNAGNSTGGNNQLMTDRTYNYTYDDEGNRISRTAIGTGAITEYVWDYHNRLTQVTEKNAAGIVTRSSNYKYDVFDRRIAKTVDLDGVGTQVATTDRYVYDGSHIALVFDEQGNQLQRFLYGTRIDQVLVQENANGDLLWALADYQGSVRDVVDSQGNTLNHLVYDSFGNVTSQTNGAINFRYGYTGRELDAETGLYYYRARYYDARTGQFIGQDPLSFGAGDSNLYRYVGNNATNLTDPSGLFSFNDATRWATDRFNDGRKAVSDGINTAGYGVKGTVDFYRNKDDVDNAYENIRPVIIARAEESRDRYVDTYNDPNANPLLRFGAGVGGTVSSLATSENYDKTKTILEGALLIDGVIMIGRALPGVIKNCKKWITAPKTLGADITNIFKNKPKTECFVAGTLILTRDGKKPIEDLRTGDWIVSWDEETGEVIERPVTEWFRREAPAIIDIFIGVQKISCTIDHPFWVEKTGWVLASHIKPGTVLRDRLGNQLIVDVVRRWNEVTPVYNIEIEGLHTYFVSELEILSHNACGEAGIGAIDDLVHSSTPIGRSGKHSIQFPNPNAPHPRNAPATINGRDFTGHAVDRMQERGFFPSVVENAIEHGVSSPGNKSGITVFTDTVNDLRVITDSATGRVISVIGGVK